MSFSDVTGTNGDTMTDDPKTLISVYTTDNGAGGTNTSDGINVRIETFIHDGSLTPNKHTTKTVDEFSITVASMLNQDLTAAAGDTTAPTITSFTIDKGDGSYKVGEAFQITANTSENIQNGNTITVTLNTGGDGTDVVLTAQADGTTLVGTYIVAAGNTSSSLTVSSFTIGTVADTAGNAMTSTTLPAAIFDGKTIVIDTTAPSMEALALTKTDGTALGATNNVKTVKLTVTSTNEVLNVSDAASFKTNMTVTKNGAINDKSDINVTNYVENTNGPYVYSAEVDLTNEGDAAYTFAFAAIDLAGNIVNLTPVSYTLDSTAPTLTTVGLSSNNGNSTLAKADDEITLTMVASENINQPTVSMQIGSTTVTPTIAGADKNWTAKYTVQAGNNGLVSFGIDFFDTTTNAGTTVTTVTNGSSVMVDTVAPVLAQVTAVPTPSNDQTPSFVFTTTKAGTLSSSLGFSTGAAVATRSNQTVTFNTLTGGTYTGKTITVTDTYGNSGSFTIPDFVIDTTAPTLTTVGLSSNNGNAALAKAGDEITLTMVASENINQPTVTMSINGTAVTPTIAGADKNWTAKYTVQAGQNGAVTFTINFSDTSSNAGTEVTTVTDGSSVTVDTVAPVLAQVTAVPTPSNDQTPSFVFTTTKAGTLTTSIAEGFSTGAAVATDSNQTVTFNTLAQNTYTGETITVTDAAGNQGSLTMPDFVIDTTPPAGFTTGSVTVAGTGTKVNGYYNASNTDGVTITVPIANDNTLLNGKVQAQVQVNSGAWTGVGSLVNVPGINTTQDVSVAHAQLTGLTNYGSGVVLSFRATLTDVGGNITTGLKSTNTLTVDTVAPTVNSQTLASNNGNTALAMSGDTVTLTVTANESINNLSGVTFKITDGATVVNKTNADVTYASTNATTKTAAFTVPASLTGDVTVTYTVTDLAGNTTTKTDQLTGSVTVDTTAPSFETVHVNQEIVSTGSDKQVYLNFKLDENVNSNGVVTTHYTAPGGTEVELTSTSKSVAQALASGPNSKVWVQNQQVLHYKVHNMYVLTYYKEMMMYMVNIE